MILLLTGIASQHAAEAVGPVREEARRLPRGSAAVPLRRSFHERLRTFPIRYGTLLLLLAASAYPATPLSLAAIVERVSDGDTLVATTADQTKLRIRLLGIDAPENANGTKVGQPFGQEARDYLDHPIGGKSVRA